MKITELLTEVNHVFEDDMSDRQMGVIIVLWMAGLVIFGALAVALIHVVGWQW